MQGNDGQLASEATRLSGDGLRNDPDRNGGSAWQPQSHGGYPVPLAEVRVFLLCDRFGTQKRGEAEASAETEASAGATAAGVVCSQGVEHCAARSLS